MTTQLNMGEKYVINNYARNNEDSYDYEYLIFNKYSNYFDVGTGEYIKKMEIYRNQERKYGKIAILFKYQFGDDGVIQCFYDGYKIIEETGDLSDCSLSSVRTWHETFGIVTKNVIVSIL